MSVVILNLDIIIDVYVLVIPNLLTFVHGCTSSINVAAKNFIDELVKNGQNVGDSSINISSVKRTIKTIATKSTRISPW